MKNTNQNFENRLSKLNPEQRHAVDTIDGPVMVIAGPGSGKTELLALRAGNILNTGHVSPHNILLLTFTESGARNMRERLTDIIGESAYRVAIYTFHSFASDIMSKYAEYFFDGASYRPATDLERIGIIENIIAQLPRKNVLSSKHFEKGYTYTSDIMSCISGLKKGNKSPQDFKEDIDILVSELKEINTFAGEYLAQCSGSRKYEVVLDAFSKIYLELERVSAGNNYAKYLANTLSLELVKSGETGSHKNLNDWRDEYFTKNENMEDSDLDTENNFKILKDSRIEKIEKWYALCGVYEKYIFEMNKNALYDFDDMIYVTARELESNQNLRNELEEKYQYIMIDEFQDTNEAQLSLVKNLTQSPVNEGRPNVLVVGDDDQAVYKFQGAELDNIFKFKKMYNGVETVVLDKNYRSTQSVLDYARNVILKAQDRIEIRDKNINKKMKAGNAKFLIDGEMQDKINGQIFENSFENLQSELDHVAIEIKKIIDSGVNPKEITVISKKHDTLKQLSNVLNIHKVPYSYDKNESVLDKQHIHELITVTNFVASGMTESGLREELLPEILSFKFWGLMRLDVWSIAEKVKSGIFIEDDLGIKVYKKISWLQAMLQSENENIKNIAHFLIELITEARDTTLEIVLDKIIGTKEYEYLGEYDEDVITEIENKTFTSPYKNFYFGKENFDHNKPEYLEFLFALRTFIGSLREFKQGKILRVTDLDEFLNIYQNNDNLTLTLTSPFATSNDAIVLQTAHKAKGLEYEYVFIINADEKSWNGRGYNNKIGLPENMKLLPESDSDDDRIRLFYVAATRAKHTLQISYNKEKLSYIMTDEEVENREKEKEVKKKSEKENKKSVTLTKELARNFYITDVPVFMQDEKVLLKRLLENYQMPVTHFTNYLNMGKVGPDKFVEQNLLRFPQAMTASSVYGSAMHAAMQAYYLYFKKYEKLADLEKVKEYFQNALLSGGLPEIEYQKYLLSGYENLTMYVSDLENRNAGNDRPKQSDMVEYNFAREGVKIGEVNASGKIDKMQFDGDTITVTDLKTGKSFSDWDEKSSSPYDAIKLHFFKYQLAYYKLLIKNSRTYNNYKVEIGKIEFLECDDRNKINILELKLGDESGLALCNRVEKLANIIYKKILNLDFPDVSKWTRDEAGNEKEVKLKDILEFEEALLAGEI